MHLHSHAVDNRFRETYFCGVAKVEIRWLDRTEVAFRWGFGAKLKKSSVDHRADSSKHLHRTQPNKDLRHIIHLDSKTATLLKRAKFILRFWMLTIRPTHCCELWGVSHNSRQTNKIAFSIVWQQLFYRMRMQIQKKKKKYTKWKRTKRKNKKKKLAKTRNKIKNKWNENKSLGSKQNS